MKKSWQRSWCI